MLFPGSKDGVARLRRFFSDKRMKDFVKEEERKEAASESIQRELEFDEMRLVVEKVIHLCRPNIQGLKPGVGIKSNYVCMLDDDRIGLSSLGTKKELVERLYEHMAHIINMFALDRGMVYKDVNASIECDEIDIDCAPCEICDSPEDSMENPIILCDGEHSRHVGYHIHCLTPALHYVPSGTWLCPACKSANLFIIEEVLDKRLIGGVVNYMVKWKGYDDPSHNSWQKAVDIPKGSKHLVTEFNKRNRGA